ncbi:MAG: hypothetical protein AUK54_07965 [Helicobacteraceae bacterium CG2_30_36_10]|nr:MAG: hypothetical protein AUK54_07965 [Helicobacteraceae bacterium CG2_30_36_10]
MKKILVITALCASLSLAGQNSSGSFDQSKFIPDISLIIDMSYVNTNVTNDDLDNNEPTSNYGDYGTFKEFNTDNGFNLNYAELALHSNADQAFELDGVFHFNPEGVEVEEAYFTTKALAYNLRAKGGKFKSDFGRLNNQHQHIWDFADAPLVYNSFLSPEGLNAPGAQLQWLVPTPWYMKLGFEMLQSGNGGTYGNDFDKKDGESLYIGYLKNSFDINDASVLLGLSYVNGTSNIIDEDGTSLYKGNSEIYGADVSVKNYFDSYSYINWQSEFLYRQMKSDDTTLYADKEQSGYYTQLVYQVAENYKTGLRYEGFLKKSNGAKISVDASYKTSEFAQLRLQYSHDDAFKQNGNYKAINEIIFELTFAIGAHGAHSF